MTTGARIGHGTILRVGNAADSPMTMTQFSEVTSITPPSETTDQIDATHMQSPGRFREFIPGLSDGGDFGFEMNFVPGNTEEDVLLAARAGGVTVQLQLQFPNGAIWDFEGFVTGYEPDVPVDDKMTVAVTFKVAGAVTVSQGT